MAELDHADMELGGGLSEEEAQMLASSLGGGDNMEEEEMACEDEDGHHTVVMLQAFGKRKFKGKIQYLIQWSSGDAPSWHWGSDVDKVVKKEFNDKQKSSS
ncbi:uncharacterized protein LOC135489667 [Lineus longissimus]|uniref:uncharacterized protein LOC135489667 n=1 Tax=Lineus longissimus TaxID=88925 RepID=UPI00315DEE19